MCGINCYRPHLSKYQRSRHLRLVSHEPVYAHATRRSFASCRVQYEATDVTQASSNDAGHIHAGSNEGILFFDSVAGITLNLMPDTCTCI